MVEKKGSLHFFGGGLFFAKNGPLDGNLTFYVLYTQFRVFSSLSTSGEVRNTCAGGRE